jgi:hypothetical protein
MARQTVGACPPINCSSRAHTDHKEVAQNFKDQGNEYFRDKWYRESLGFYTQDVEAKPDDFRLREALLLNRAACNLELRASLVSPLPFLPLYPQAFLLGYIENYGSVLRDCATVIATNSRAPSKSYYRAGIALLSLERPDEALDVCGRAGEETRAARS